MESSNTINEIISEYGLRSVSIKTNIPTDTLEKLSTGELDSFTKIQIIGFAKIFEREYDIDLSEFKNDIRQHFINHSHSPKQSILLIGQESSSVGGTFAKLIPYLFFIAILYGAWYIYQNFYKKSNITPIAQVDKVENRYFDIEKNKSSLDNKKNNIYSMQVLEDSKKKTTAKLESNTTVITDSNSSHSTKTINKTDNNETNTTKSAVKKENVVEAKDIEVAHTPLPRSSIDLIPSKGMWFRITNVQSRKYRTYRKQIEPFRFDLTKTTWLMATKKGLFTLIDNNVSKEYNSNTPLYFKIDKTTGITPLSYQEYRKLGGYSVN
ncbi:MAG: hypothetical protein U9N49_02255 [Campylobacterota bacterium]|nr:hypothetical protein [Campylobacterota bacterium]